MIKSQDNAKRKINYLSELTNFFITCLNQNIFDDFYFDPIDGFFYTGQPHYIKDKLCPISEILDSNTWQEDMQSIRQNITSIKYNIDFDTASVSLEDEDYQLEEAIKNYLITHIKLQYRYLFD